MPRPSILNSDLGYMSVLPPPNFRYALYSKFGKLEFDSFLPSFFPVADSSKSNTNKTLFAISVATTSAFDPPARAANQPL